MRAEYKYDVFGNRIAKTVDSDGDGPLPGETLRFALDGWNTAKGAAIGNENWDVWADFAADGSLKSRYLRGDAVDELFGRADATPSGLSAKWTLADRLGSVRLVLAADGSVLDAIRYDAFGQIVSETDASERGRYAWTGRERDVETDLQYNRARYYDASTGRWTTQDPLGHQAGDANLNRYVHNRPVIATDPSGLWTPVGILTAFEKKFGEKGRVLLLSALKAGVSIENDEDEFWFSRAHYDKEENTIFIAKTAGWGWFSRELTDDEAASALFGELDARFTKGFLAERALNFTANVTGGNARTAALADDPWFARHVPDIQAVKQEVEAAKTHVTLMANTAVIDVRNELYFLAASFAAGKTVQVGANAWSAWRRARADLFTPLRNALRGRAVADLSYREVGNIGESIALRWLQGEGYRNVRALQNASNNGLDVIARTPDGRLAIFEVKTTKTPGSKNGWGRLPARQQDGVTFARDVLNRAARGEYSNLSRADRDFARSALAELNRDPARVTSVLVGIDLVNEVMRVSPWRTRN